MGRSEERLPPIPLISSSLQGTQQSSRPAQRCARRCRRRPPISIEATRVRTRFPFAFAFRRIRATSPPGGALGFSLDLRSVGGNPCARKGRENFSCCGSHGGDAKSRALAGFAFPLARSGNPGATRATRLAAGACRETRRSHHGSNDLREGHEGNRNFPRPQRLRRHRAGLGARQRQSRLHRLRGRRSGLRDDEDQRGVRGFPEEGPADREGLERLAAAYLERFGEGDIAIRFDIVGMMVLGDSRGFLRLHRNTLSAL